MNCSKCNIPAIQNVADFKFFLVCPQCKEEIAVVTAATPIETKQEPSTIPPSGSMYDWLTIL